MEAIESTSKGVRDSKAMDDLVRLWLRCMKCLRLSGPEGSYNYAENRTRRVSS